MSITSESLLSTSGSQSSSVISLESSSVLSPTLDRPLSTVASQESQISSASPSSVGSTSRPVSSNTTRRPSLPDMPDNVTTSDAVSVPLSLSSNSVSLPVSSRSSSSLATSRSSVATATRTVSSITRGPVPDPGAGVSSGFSQPTPSQQQPSISTNDRVPTGQTGKRSTTTVTSHPTTTLSSPIALTVTDPNNGVVSLTTPDLVTFISTTESDGELLTITNVVANPDSTQTIISGAVTTTGGFLSNQGRVAGVFIAVGIAAAIAFLLIFLCFRRARKQRRRKRWLNSIKRPLPLPEDPFEDPRDPPLSPRDIRPSSSNAHQNSWERRYSPTYDEKPVQMRAAESPQGLGLIGVTPGHRLFNQSPSHDQDVMMTQIDHLQPYQHGGGPVLLTPKLPTAQSGPSIAPTSPSIYPEDLPTNDDVSSLFEVDMGSQPVPPIPAVLPPNRPPRSHLRTVPPPVSYDFTPLTPPLSGDDSYTISARSSVSSGGAPSRLGQKGTSLDDIFTRKTMLDVRSRTSNEGSLE